MSPQIIKQWELRKDVLRDYFKGIKNIYDISYETIVKKIFELVITEADYEEDDGYDIDKLVTLDHGHYQGTQIFIIPKNTYQPSVEDYLVTHTYYGSCSGCDTLQAILSNLGYDEDEPITDKDVDQLMLLALHLVQKIRKLGED